MLRKYDLAVKYVLQPTSISVIYSDFTCITFLALASLPNSAAYTDDFLTLLKCVTKVNLLIDLKTSVIFTIL